MKIKDYNPTKPIILGDLGEEPKSLPKLTDEQLIAMQQPSTQRTLKRATSEDLAWFLRPDPEKEQWKREVKAREELYEGHFHDTKEQMRTRSGRDILKFAYRQDRTPVIREDNIDGYLTDLRSFDESKRKVTIDAFNYQSSKFDPLKPGYLEEIMGSEKWMKMPWYKAIWHWLMGNKIRLEDE
jgi:hypothetical protein